MKWLHVVRYKKEGRFKQKIFDEEDEAKAFYNKCVKYGDPAIRFREQPIPYWKNLLETKFKWLGAEMDLIWLIAVALLLLVAYETQGTFL